MIHILGGGLAGVEAAWQAAGRGRTVVIHEMRPVGRTAVHRTDRLGELVCSNSFRSDKLDNAVGLLKEEMRCLGSLVMRVADGVRVPAGAALAVDRERFAEAITSEIEAHPLITLVREEVTEVPDPAAAGGPVIVATGPLTSPALSASIAALVGHSQLAFWDAISPIVLADSIDFSRVFRASRWGRSAARASAEACPTPVAVAPASLPAAQGSIAAASIGVGAVFPNDNPVSQSCDWGRPLRPQCEGEGDYLNCPFTQAEYEAFHHALTTAERASVRDFEKERFFEGCLPIEVMAHRGVDTLRFGPMKPVGLTDPRTGGRAYAVAQLRQDNLAADHYSLVGFQTQLTFGEQARVFRMIPGLERAEFARFGLVHRNTYINGPRVLAETWQTRSRPTLLFAGQVSGVEGYVESAASGLLAGINAAALDAGRPASAPPRTTAIGALSYYASHADADHYQPSNITFGIMAPPDASGGRLRRDRKARNEAISARALRDLDSWRLAAGG